MKTDDLVDLWEIPQSEEIFMLMGWRQWADAGSTSSGLPLYLAQQTKARPIGKIRSESFYLFQFPGTHDLVRPVVKFNQGLPESLQVPRNELFFSGDKLRGIVYFIGDEPHLNVEIYVESLLNTAQILKVKRMVGFGGVYGELPYDKERIVSSTYSLPRLKAELENLAVTFSDYHGGASIGSYICRRASERGMEYISFYAFVPAYDFTNISPINSSIRIENDFLAWLGIMRRVNYLLKTEFDLTDLEKRSQTLIHTVDEKMSELDRSAPSLGIKDYLRKLSEEFIETPFDPLTMVWDEKLRRILDKLDNTEEENQNPEQSD